jgi:hypothetical protein
MRSRLAQPVPPFDPVPAHVIAAALRAFDQTRHPGADMAEIVYDSRLDPAAASDTSRVLVFAEAANLSLQLRIIPDRLGCFVVGHYYPSWPTFVSAETGSETIPFGVDSTGQFVAERLSHGPVRFVFEQEAGEAGGVVTDWMTI